jgi:hypothetical protein
MIMRKLILLCASLCVMALFSGTTVLAQQTLWVSPNGSDNNICSETSPCFTFQGAINKGNVGQIFCLGSGAYGSFSVSASITIDCGAGNFGTATVSANSTVVLTNTSAATIVLRHLNLFGAGTARTGIDASGFSSGTLIIEDCQIHGFHGGDGILFEPTGGRGLLQVSNTQIFDNQNGITVQPTNQIASVTLNRVELVANTDFGLVLGGVGTVAGTMRDSVVGENGSTGVLTSASQVFFTVEGSSIIANLGGGVVAGSGGSNVNVTASTISGNATGVATASPTASLVSFGNNTLTGNGVNGNFTSTAALR